MKSGMRLSIGAVLVCVSGSAFASGYSISIFRGNSTRGVTLGMTGDGINSRGDIVGQAPVFATIDNVDHQSWHGAVVRSGVFTDLPDLDNDVCLASTTFLRWRDVIVAEQTSTRRLAAAAPGRSRSIPPGSSSAGRPTPCPAKIRFNAR